MLASRLTSHALDGARDRDSCQNSAGGASNGGGNRCDARLAFCDRLCPASATNLREHRCIESRAIQTAVQAVGFFPCKKNLRGRTCLHGEGRTNGNGIAKPHFAFRSGNAHAEVALTTEKLCRFLGVIAQCDQNGHCGSKQTVLAGRRGEFLETRPQNETSLHVACNEAVILQCDGQAVCCWACKTRCCDQLCKGGRTCFEGAQNQCGFI